MLLSLLSKKTFILTFIHLCTFCLKINLSKYLPSIISDYENYTNIYHYLIIIFVVYQLVNMIHTRFFFCIKKEIASATTLLYTNSLKKYITSSNLQKNKSYEASLMEISTYIEIIYETYILTMPKTIIYTVYYIYSIFSYSFTSGAILLLMDLCVIYFYKYRDITKEKVYSDLYEANFNLKNEQKNTIDKEDVTNLNILIKKRDIMKTNEIRYLSDEIKYSEFINNLVELMIFIFGIKYLILKEMKPFDLIYHSMKSVNFINHTVNLIEQLNIKTKYKTQLDNIYRIHEIDI
ncbi:hypothetical protein Catovirus_2_165 [Catovirus CTV1]|uniref:Uncharacterized protein n=1 Tax=Catovirus CTV1 TaxID=1977631 RepID=A0A1V0SBY5_9VIRU|nr:hypothetical protein Catovirus_2_165 [Catovirus CTV1]